MTITYPDGSQLTSTALTDDDVQIALQAATAQMLGIRIFNVQLTLTSGSNVAVPQSMAALIAGQSIDGDGIPPGTTIQSIGSGNITLSAAATASGQVIAHVADPGAYEKVRVGWQQEGAPAWGITDDVVIVRASTIDSGYSHLRDLATTAGADVITETDTFTRRWRGFWTFYGPNSLDHAGAVRSALIKIPFVADLFATSNLYVDPDITEPGRNPEQFQGEWWSRSDLSADFNEQITETYTAGIVASVEVSVNTEGGQTADFIVSV